MGRKRKIIKSTVKSRSNSSLNKKRIIKNNEIINKLKSENKVIKN
jgi:hypothetical protein